MGEQALFVGAFAVCFLFLKTFCVNEWIVTLGVGVAAWALAGLVSKAIVKLVPRRLIDPDNKAVFITGCDSGFGHDLAKNLDQLGFHIYAGCLFPDSGGAVQLKEECSERLRIIPLDVTREIQVKAAVKEVESSLNGKELWALVNNAGIATYTEIEWCSIETYQKIFDVNSLGSIRVTKSFLPLLRESRGRVIFIASLAGRYTFPGFSAYSMSKYAIISFADALRREMRKWNVTVHTVEPTLYKTPISAVGTMTSILKSAWESTPSTIQESYGEEYYQALKQTLTGVCQSARTNVDEVVKEMVDAVASENPKMRYVPGTKVQIRAKVLEVVPTNLQDYLLCLKQPHCPPAAMRLPSIEQLRPEFRRSQSEPVKIRNYASNLLNRCTKYLTTKNPSLSEKVQ